MSFIRKIISIELGILLISLFMLAFMLIYSFCSDTKITIYPQETLEEYEARMKEYEPEEVAKRYYGVKDYESLLKDY